MGKVALIDGDILVYRIGFACQKTLWRISHKDSPDIVHLIENSKRDFNSYIRNRNLKDLVILKELQWGNIEEVYQTVRLSLANIVFGSEAEDIKIYIGGSTNFRNEVAETISYKGNRKGIEKPLHYKNIRKYMENVFHAEITEGIETDDALGIAQTENTVICSVDKDLDQIPGDHYNWIRNEYYTVSPFEGVKSFYSQLLMGDAIDNILGIYGIGRVKAHKLIEEVTSNDELVEIVSKEYRKAFDAFWKERLIENSKLLWILREPLGETPLSNPLIEGLDNVK